MYDFFQIKSIILNNSQKRLHVFYLASFMASLFASDAITASFYTLARNYPKHMPLNFMDQNGRPTGFETELMQEIAKRADLNLKEEFVSNTYSVLQSVRKNKTDLGIGAVTVTLEREQYFDFSEHYLQVNHH